MPFIDQPGSFIVAVLAFQLVPGPGTLNILRATADHGIKAGFASVAGTLIGGLVCMLAAASGLEAVFRGQPEATQALKWAGSLYLAWMGWKLLARVGDLGVARPAAAPTLALHLRSALAISLTNPKVILFYFALLPLFVRAPFTPASLAGLAGIVMGISLLYQGALVLVGNSVTQRMRSLPSARSAAQRLAGLAFIAFALKLVAF
jgi:threonine/homoserine/homoserine lactone efflux protein